jgi:hypothetical protein
MERLSIWELSNFPKNPDTALEAHVRNAVADVVDTIAVAPVVKPTTVCVRCGMALDTAADLRQHWKRLHAHPASVNPSGPSRTGVGSDAVSSTVAAVISVDDVEDDEDSESETGALSASEHDDEGSDDDVPHLTWDKSLLPSGPMVPVCVNGHTGFVYKALLASSGDPSAAEYAENRFRRNLLCKDMSLLLNPGETWASLMFQSGFFAAAVFQLSPTDCQLREGELLSRIEKVKQQAWPRALLHKRCHRYTTRKKQGGSQSAHDAARGSAANSIGAQLRRAGEVHLQEDIMELLSDPLWVSMLTGCRRIFLACPRTARAKLFEAPTLKRDDPRLVFVPIATGRPSLAENTRICETMASFWKCARSDIHLHVGRVAPDRSAARIPASSPPKRVPVAEETVTSHPNKKKRHRKQRAANPAIHIPVEEDAEHLEAMSDPDEEVALAAAMAAAAVEREVLDAKGHARHIRDHQMEEVEVSVAAAAAKLRIPVSALRTALQIGALSPSSESFEQRAAAIARKCLSIVGMLDAGSSSSAALQVVGLDMLSAASVIAEMGMLVDWSDIGVVGDDPVHERVIADDDVPSIAVGGTHSKKPKKQKKPRAVISAGIPAAGMPLPPAFFSAPSVVEPPAPQTLMREAALRRLAARTEVLR